MQYSYQFPKVYAPIAIHLTVCFHSVLVALTIHSKDLFVAFAMAAGTEFAEQALATA